MKLLELLSTKERLDAFFQYFKPAVMREDLESFDLGFGWMFYSLARIFKPKAILAIGALRGFSVACFAMGQLDNGTGTTTFVDAGYDKFKGESKSWGGDGYWKKPEAMKHFSKVGLENVELLVMTDEEAFARFELENRTFGLIYIDADHRYDSVLYDCRRGWQFLEGNGVMVLHDTFTWRARGVGKAGEEFIDEVKLGRAGTGVSLNIHPGLTIIFKQGDDPDGNAWRTKAQPRKR